MAEASSREARPDDLMASPVAEIATREEILGWLSVAAKAGHVGAMRLLLEELRRDNEAQAASTPSIIDELMSRRTKARRPYRMTSQKNRSRARDGEQRGVAFRALSAPTPSPPGRRARVGEPCSRW
jgi:hypothetical protein